MKVLTVKEVREFETYTMEQSGIQVIDLMRKAGHLIVKDILKRVKPKYESKITVFAGVGNNGGDSLVVAIELKKLGYKPNVFVVGDVKQATDAFLHYYDLAGQVRVINSIEEVNQYQEVIFESDLILDGILGIGLTKEVKGYRRQLFEYINESDTEVYSIDVPSGINPENGLAMGVAIKATYTGVLGYYKIGNLINDALDFHGSIEFLDLGILEKEMINREAVSIKDYKLEQPFRNHDTNKYSYGLGVYIGGRKSMMGSVQMSAISGLKSGLGIVSVISDLDHNDFTQFYPEIIIGHNTGKEQFALLDKAKTVVFGPGLSNHPNHKVLLDYVLDSDTPLIIDASGLDYLELKEYKNKNILLTPHVGELSRMLGVSVRKIKEDPLKHLKKFTDLGFSVLLKGPCNILVSDGRIVFIQVKNTGLATAGSGDVLCGILSANITKGDFLEGMIKSVYIHAKAADFARAKFGEVSMTATDIISNLYKVFKE